MYPDRRFILLFLVCALFFSAAAESDNTSSPLQAPHLLVLDNCDSDYKNPPFNDEILFLNDKGEFIRKIGGLNICQSGGNRAISVSEDGHFFVVCENADQITGFEMVTGKELWSLPGKYRSAVIRNNITYALVSDGTIYGEGIQAIDNQGNIIKLSNEAKGIDLVVDPNSNILWIIGVDVKKCDMNFKILQTINPITFCAFSVDINPDGSIWVAERQHIEVDKSTNRLIKISSQGKLVQSIPLNNLTPLCVRVDRSDGSVWITGISLRIQKLPFFHRWSLGWRQTLKYLGSRTQKYSAQGQLLLTIEKGGNSMDIDPIDRSVWIDTDSNELLHYSRHGKKLGTYSNVSGNPKWIAVVPEKEKVD